MVLFQALVLVSIFQWNFVFEAIEIVYIRFKSEQHRLTPKYDIMYSLVPLVKNYFVTMEEYDNQLKITSQRCNDFLTCSFRSRKKSTLPFYML